MLIVVDKLLVGFDEPRNRVLYIDKPLKEHGLLQAIARVNRVFEGKDEGLIIDYRGVLGELNAALETYNALEGYDPEDVAGMVSDISTEIDKLPELHAALWEVFRPVENPQDAESMERYLAPEDKRQQFYDALAAFARSLRVALGSVTFYEQTSNETISAYRRDLAFFHNLRMSAKHRYAEIIDYKDYEQKIRKLMDEHIKAEGTRPITELVDIFDAEAFASEVDKLSTPAARADTIANRLRRTISEKMELDPAFYLKFSRLIEDAIRAYEEGRIGELEYLEIVSDALEQIQAGHERGEPLRLKYYRHASAYYGIIHDALIMKDWTFLGNEIADVAIELEKVIEAHKIRDWASNPDIQNEIRNAIDDTLYGVKNDFGLDVTGPQIDLLVEQLLDVARKRDGL
jgi:type I restriction enzyme, R subunit